MIRQAAVVFLTLFTADAAAAQALAPGDFTDAEKAEYLKLGYILNGNSMVRWGSIDLTAPRQATPDEIMGQPRTIPIEPPKKDKRK
jgi:hypothetical protein